MKGKVVIKKAEISELEELIPIYKAVFKVHDIFVRPDDEILDYLKGRVDGFLVAKVDGKVVGGVLLRKVEDGWRLNHFAVASGYRDLGIGKSLMEAAEEKAGPGVISVRVSQHEAVALPFFKKMGFEVVEEVMGHYREGEKVYFLEKKI